MQTPNVCRGTRTGICLMPSTSQTSDYDAPGTRSTPTATILRLLGQRNSWTPSIRLFSNKDSTNRESHGEPLASHGETGRLAPRGSAFVPLLRLNICMQAGTATWMLKTAVDVVKLADGSVPVFRPRCDCFCSGSVAPVSKEYAPPSSPCLKSGTSSGGKT